MVTDWEKELILRSAWYYYIQKKTQKEIADQLNISRMRVVRLLEKAEEENIIQIKISSYCQQRIGIEDQLISKYHLQDAFVVPGDKNLSTSGLNEIVSKAAAMYIDEHFGENPVINIGYGDTTGRVMDYFSRISEKKPTYVSLTGGVSIYLLNSKSTVGNAKLYLIPAPFIASTKEVVDAIKKENAVIEISRMHATASCSIIGIGGMSDEATVIKAGIISKSDFDFLKMKGAVGDVLAHFFDKDGCLIPNSTDEHLIACPLDSLKKMKNVIAIAAGPAKYAAIRAALRAGYPNILITDEQTAEWLVNNI